MNASQKKPATARAQRIVTATVVFVATATVTVMCGAPAVGSWYVRKQIRERYPWVQPKTVAFKWPFTHVELSDVAFDKGWMKGTLTKMTVNRETKDVYVTGGEVEADLDKKPSGGATSVSEFHPFIELTLVTVRRGGVTVVADKVVWSGRRVTFNGAGIETPWAHIDTASGSYEPKYGARLTKVGARISVPTKIPGIDLSEVNVTGEEVFIDETSQSVEIGRVTVHQPASPEHIELLTAGEVKVSHTGAFQARWVQFQHPWISPKPERFQDIRGAVKQKPALEILIHEPLIVQVLPAEQWVSVQGSCEEWALTIQRDTVLQLVGFDGRLAVGVGMKPIPHVKMDSATYPATCIPRNCQPFKALKKPFKYTAIRADGTPFERTSGPGTPDWISLGGAGKMSVAVESLEDPGFSSHRGFIRQAYENSLIENFKTGKFVRGGSTLTMQLAKNLFLQREKTLLRKAQELLIAMALEKCLSKPEIMELYLNVVEFGPNTYGIGPGSKLWFKKAPEALSPVEAFWMASILPRPRKASPPSEQSLKGISRLMGLLAKQGKIPDFGEDGEEVDTSGWEPK
jgi:hypothetical protein